MNIYLAIIIFIILIMLFRDPNEKYDNLTSQLIQKIEKFSEILPEKLNERLNSDEFEVYLIHMAKNPERLKSFQANYSNSDMSFKKFNIFPAVVGKDLNLIEYVSPKGYQQILMSEKTGTRMHHYDLTRGAVGCYLSHLSIYKMIIEKNMKYGIIFEDDSMIANDFYKRLLHGLNKIPKNWDIFLLGVICLKCDVGKDYINIKRFWGTHGYMVSNESAKKLLEYLDKPLSKQIDADMSLLIKKGIINVYAINPVIVAQDTKFGSDIQMSVTDSAEVFNEEFKQGMLMDLYGKNRIVRVGYE